MASPIGHSLAGYAVYGFSTTAQGPDRFNLILLCILMANVPDLDFLPGILMGSPALYHQGIMHSLGFAFMVSLGTVVLYSLRTSSSSALFTPFFISYLSHLIIDYFGPDRRPPYGQPLFWPISAEYFISPVSVFLGMHHAGSTHASTLDWILGILSLDNIQAIALEVAVAGPFVLSGKLWRRGLLGQQGPSS